MASFRVSLPSKSLRIVPKVNFENAFFRLFCLYICTGNLWRLFPTPIFKESILISEVLLFIACFSHFFLKETYSFRHLKFLFVAGIILCSSAYGAVLNGFDLASTLYAVRLVCLILCGVLIGEIFFNKFGTSIVDFYKSISFYFTVQMSIGFLIYICFRDSRAFWLFLSYLGVTYNGDPHMGRFLSVYFDPNFYAAIAVIPFIAMYRLARLSCSYKNYLRLGFLTLSIVLTWSRSGIATLFILLFFLFFNFILKLKRYLFKNKMVLGIIAGLIIAGIALILRFEDASVFFVRLITVRTENSAFSRWYSFSLGLDVFCQYPLFGVGYNYLSQFVKGLLSGSSIDSSVLATFVNFGLIQSTLFAFLFSFYVHKFRTSYSAIKSKSPELFTACNLYLVYLLSIVVFASVFNNLLYFQFWLVPMIAIFTYLSLCLRTVSKACR